MMVLVILFFLIAAPVLSQECDNDSISVKPIDELGVSTYNDSTGGLYAGGSNTRPSLLDSIGQVRAKEIAPRLANGAIDYSTGKIGWVFLGNSNAVRLASFIEDTLTAAASADNQINREINPYLSFVNAAVGGMVSDSLSDTTTVYWSTSVPDSLTAASIDPKQVGVVFISTATRLNETTLPATTWPQYPNHVRSRYKRIARILMAKYPNVKVLLFSNSAYIDYAATAQRTKWQEPYVYWHGFATKGAIHDIYNAVADSVSTDKNLNNPQGSVPYVDYLTYMWADGIAGGTTARTDGFQWDCADFESDGIHFDVNARRRVFNRWYAALKNDAVNQIWLLRNPGFYNQ